jgi:hypothetical protein
MWHAKSKAYGRFSKALYSSLTDQLNGISGKCHELNSLGSGQLLFLG